MNKAFEIKNKDAISIFNMIISNESTNFDLGLRLLNNLDFEICDDVYSLLERHIWKLADSLEAFWVNRKDCKTNREYRAALKENKIKKNKVRNVISILRHRSSELESYMYNRFMKTISNNE